MATPIAVTIEYPRVGFPERIHHLGEDLGVEVLPLLEDPFPAALDAVGYAAELLSRVPEDREVVLVASLCLGTPIGYHVARLAAERGGRTPVFVALDGAPVLVKEVEHAYRTAVERYARAGSPPAVAVTEQALAADPAGLVERMRAELTTLATAALAPGAKPDAAPPPLVLDLVDAAMDWTVQLVAAHRTPDLPFAGEAVLVLSDDAAFQDAWPGAAHTRHDLVGGSGDDLVGSAGLRRILARELAAVTGA